MQKEEKFVFPPVARGFKCSKKLHDGLGDAETTDKVSTQTLTVTMKMKSRFNSIMQKRMVRLFSAQHGDASRE